MLLTKSQAFTGYNKHKAINRMLDDARTNRALGYLLSEEKEAKLSVYNATANHCDCPNFHFTDGNCKHVRARRMQLEGRKYFTITFWAHTYDPEKLLKADITELPVLVEEILYSHIEVLTNENPKFRPVTKSNLEVIEAIRENGYRLAWTALVRTKNFGTWNGKFEMTFFIEK